MKVGDYVRYRKFNFLTQEYCDKIAKITNIDTEKSRFKANFIFLDNGGGELEQNITKSSPNIIDLIKVGDFVNGERIIDIRNDNNINNEKLLYYYIPSDYGEDYFRERDIKSIVTEKQFEDMEYWI